MTPGGPAFESDHVLVAVRQGADGDQDAAQVFHRLAAGQFVERVVGEWASAGPKVAQDCRSGALVQVRKAL
jgi:hypothetical protein